MAILDIQSLGIFERYQLARLNMLAPSELSADRVSDSFVYCRGFGVFRVFEGEHAKAMSMLLAIEMGCSSGEDVAEMMGLEFPHGTAEYWLEHSEGAAFRRSPDSRVVVGEYTRPSPLELRHFGAFARGI